MIDNPPRQPVPLITNSISEGWVKAWRVHKTAAHILHSARLTEVRRKKYKLDCQYLKDEIN